MVNLHRLLQAARMATNLSSGQKLPALLCLLLLCLVPLSGSARSASQAGNPYLDIYLPNLSKAELPSWIGPDGGYIVALAAAPSDPNLLYAGTWGSGVFKSENGGKNWSNHSQGLSKAYINSLAVDPVDPCLVYAGVYKAGLYKTTNCGLSWNLASSGIQPEATTYAIAIDPESRHRLYIATRGISNNGYPPWNGVIYRSDDHGDNWLPVLTDVRSPANQDWAYSLAVVPDSPNQVFAAFHDSGAYRSENYGATWDLIAAGLGDDRSGRSIVVDPTNPLDPTLYLGMWHGDGVYKSENGGELWQLKSNGIYSAKVIQISIDPFDPAVLYLATTNLGVRKTTNGADSWQPAGLQTETLYTLITTRHERDRLFAGTAGSGLFTSQNGGATWEHSQAGLSATSVTGLVVHPENPESLYAGTYGGGAVFSPDTGASWQVFNTNLEDRMLTGLFSCPGRPGLLFALTETSGLYRIDINRSTGWEKVWMGLPEASFSSFSYPSDHPFARPTNPLDTLDAAPANPAFLQMPNSPAKYPALLTLAFAPSNPDQLYVGTAGAGVYKSLDAGQTWTSAGPGGSSISALAIDPQDPAVLFASNGLPGGLFLTTDAGQTWNPAGLPDLSVLSLAALSSSSTSFFAGTYQGLFRYSNGNNWEPAGLSGLVISALAPHPAHPGVLLAGTTGSGAYFSLDSGLNWLKVPYLSADKTVHSFGFDPQNSTVIYINTNNHGTMRLKIKQLEGLLP